MFAASPRRSSIDQGLVTADIAAKSLRKAQIRDAGADNIVLVLQDRLDTQTADGFYVVMTEINHGHGRRAYVSRRFQWQGTLMPLNQTSGSDGMAEGREEARRYLVNCVRFNASVDPRDCLRRAADGTGSAAAEG
jgi:hypothetical protein